MKLSLGPILYYWPKQTVLDFYLRAKDSCADTIYLGESVCGKRHQLRSGEWLELARDLANNSDKEIVLSSLALIESNADLNAVKKLCEQNNILVEAGDLAAVEMLSQQNLPFVCGSSINIYNQHTLNLLQRQGMQRWVMPVELNRTTLIDILAVLTEPVETEVFAYGQLPLAYSARCFTARALDLGKDDCNFRCIDYPQGMPLTSQEDQTLFTINGIQTLSGHCYNLIDELAEMEKMGEFFLALAQERAQKQGVAASYTLHHGDLHDAIKTAARQPDVTLVVLGKPGGAESAFVPESLEALATEIEFEAKTPVRIL